ncbi:NAD(P)H-dependent glycerol-3-phosphate dehydrogenase [Psychrobacter sp. 2Y5]|uniref:NAD(P)H-dependent glycerol-3-phosphate dehydrogenase n=1 Tax=unclassified Psychrobacter TaxID=196806 RepID=UPI003F488CE2
MTSSSDTDRQDKNADNAELENNQAKETAGRDNLKNNDNSNENKPTGLIASILDRATKSGFGRKKLNPNKVEAAVAKQMDQIHKNPEKIRLTVLGGGSFGTAMANLAARNGCDTTLWVRNKRTVKSMAKTQMNKKYLPGYKLDNRLKYSYDLEAAVKNKDIIFLAVPSSAFRETLKNIKPFISGQSIVSLTKGMEKDTFAMMSDIIKDELPEVNFGVMSGPNLAVEIMKNMPSATVIASESEPLRHAVQAALHSAFFRVFASDDIRGVELGGALKNIYAIAMGMAAAYDVGENTKAMLLTRSLAEMSRFGVEEGANPLTFLGLSGVGDLYATCNSELSRNFRIGNMLGRGMNIDAAVKKLGQTAEGVNTIQQVHEKASKQGIYMPITHALHAVIYEDKAALGVALHLMEAGFRSDVEFVMPHDHSNASLTAQMNAASSTNDSGEDSRDNSIDNNDSNNDKNK